MRSRSPACDFSASNSSSAFVSPTASGNPSSTAAHTAGGMVSFLTTQSTAAFRLLPLEYGLDFLLHATSATFITSATSASILALSDSTGSRSLPDSISA